MMTYWFRWPNGGMQMFSSKRSEAVMTARGLAAVAFVTALFAPLAVAVIAGGEAGRIALVVAVVVIIGTLLFLRAT